MHYLGCAIFVVYAPIDDPRHYDEPIRRKGWTGRSVF